MTRDEIAAALREKARVLYEGRLTPHRSCGIALAEAFDRGTLAYQALRRGGLDGEGPCGAILAGQLLLGELLGYADPTAPAAQALRDAMADYRVAVAARVVDGRAPSQRCRDLVARFPIFASEERALFCTDVIATVAEIVAGIAQAHGATLVPTPIAGLAAALKRGA
jgi:hypothetical protein